MPVTCPNCTAQNSSTAKFCLVCGSPLTGLSAQAVPPAPMGQLNPIVAPLPTKLMSSPPGQGGPASLLMPDGTNIDLEQQNTIGRDPNFCNLSFPSDTQLSRRHARIAEVNGVWMLEDVGSSNGTYHNQQKLQGPVQLQPGDQIGLGSITYVFMLANTPLPNQSMLPVQPGFTPPVVVPPAPIIPVGPTPAGQAPAGGWRVWNTPPATEGYVRQISDRYTMKKNDLLKRGVAAAALAIFISPAVAFIPLMQGNDIAARDLRVEDHILGHMMDVKILGDMMGNITQGDAVAIWGKNQGGLLIMDAGFNYATQTEIQIVKK